MDILPSKIANTLTEKPDITTATITPISIPFCKTKDLYLEIGTLPSTLRGLPVIRVILYSKNVDYECHVETLVNFKLEDEDGKLLPIEGNNGLAFSKGNIVHSKGFQHGVGAVWYWHNYCQNGKTNIQLIGSAAGLQSKKVVLTTPICFDENTSSYIDPYTFSANNHITIEWLGTATPIP